MKKAIAEVLLVLLLISLLGCNLKKNSTLIDSYLNLYSEVSYEYYENGYWCDIYNIFRNGNNYYVIVSAIPSDIDDTNLYEHYSVHKINESGDLIETYQISNINPYVMSDVYNNILYYITYDGKLVKFDLNTGLFIDSVQLDGYLCGVACLDDGYVILRDRQIEKYDDDNTLITTVNSNEWEMYYGMGTFFSNNNEYYLVSNSGNDYRYYSIDFDNSSSEFLFTTAGLEKVTDYCYKQYIFNNEGEMCLDFKANTLTSLLKWNSIDIQPQKCGLSNSPTYIAFDDDNFAKIYTYEDGTSQLLLYSYISTEVYTKSEIVIGGYDLIDDPSLKWAVYKFNKSQDEYRAVIEDYSYIFGHNEDPTQTTAALLEYFNDGNSPDIFYGNWFDYETLYSSGMTQNIIPYMSDNAEELFLGVTDNIRELMLNEYGECYRVFASYQLEGYIGSNNFLQGNDDISISELMEISEQTGVMPMDFAYSSDIAYSTIAYSIRSSGSIEEEDIISVLEYAYANGYQNSNYYSIQSLDRTTVNEFVLWNYGVFLPSIHSEREIECETELLYVGFPSVTSSVHLLIPQGQVALSSSTLYPEQCCELMSYLLDSEVQLFNTMNCQIPVNQYILEYFCNASVNHSIMENQNVFNYLELFDEISSDTKERFLQAVYSADSVLLYDWGMREIIEDEVDSYYSQGRSVEEIASTMKSRLDLYMAENYG